MSRTHAHLCLLLLAALPACDWFLNYRDDPNYCPGRPHNNCLADGGSTSCTSDQDCAGALAVCDVAGTMTCVQCTPEKRDACSGATPACIDNACRPCTAHAQCDSRACLIDDGGTCAASGDVAYVQAGGGGATCTLAEPCATVAAGMATGRRYLKLAAGTVKDTATTTIEGRTLTILADPGTTLDRDGDGRILLVRGANTSVSISDLRIAGASMANEAIQLEPNGGNPALSLIRVTLEGNQSGGITAGGGALTITQSTITGHPGAGVVMTGGALSISRSTISLNVGGGISLSGAGATFDLTNNFIYRNGDEIVGLVGGVNLGATTAGANRFEFNTVVDNRVSMGATRSGGVVCDILMFTAPNNLIARNRIGIDPTAPNAQTLGICAYPTSKIQNDVATLGFVSPDMTPISYKLSEGSSAIDQAATPSSVAIDHDGDARPQGSQKDLGADELRR